MLAYGLTSLPTVTCQTAPCANQLIKKGAVQALLPYNKTALMVRVRNGTKADQASDAKFGINISPPPPRARTMDEVPTGCRNLK